MASEPSTMSPDEIMAVLKDHFTNYRGDLFGFAYDAVASMKAELAAAQKENNRLLDAWMQDETIGITDGKDDGSLRPSIRKTIERAEEAEASLAASQALLAEMREALKEAFAYTSEELRMSQRVQKIPGWLDEARTVLAKSPADALAAHIGMDCDICGVELPPKEWRICAKCHEAELAAHDEEVRRKVLEEAAQYCLSVAENSDGSLLADAALGLKVARDLLRHRAEEKTATTDANNVWIRSPGKPVAGEKP